MSLTPVRVINITSLSFTGTTWLNTLLGCHRDAFALGPPDRFTDLWSKDPEKLCLVHGKDCSFWPAFCRAYDPAQNFFVQFARHTGRSVIAINNPVPDKFGRQLEHPDVKVARVFVVRDGRAVAASYARHLKVSFDKALLEWFKPAMEGVLATQRALGAPLFRHEDALADPRTMLDSIGRLVGITYPPNADRYWEFDHHPIMGNVGMVALFKLHQNIPLVNFEGREFYEQKYRESVAGGDGGKFSDERWKDELSERDRCLFDVECGELNERMGYERERFSRSAQRRLLGRAGPSATARVISKGKERVVRLLKGARRRAARLVRPPAAAKSADPTTQDGDRQAVTDQFRATIARCRARFPEPPYQLTFDHWDNAARLASYYAVYDDGLARAVPNFSESIGLDFGCWSGFSSYLMLLLGAKEVMGVDVVPEAVVQAKAWSGFADLRELNFVCAPMTPRFQLVLPTAFFDWVAIGQVYCSLNPQSIEVALDEIVRVLRPGGVVYLNDSNNPHCPETRTRLLEQYRKFEIGEGTPEAPAGEIFLERVQLIRSQFAQLSDETVRALARGTCYQWKPEILAAAKSHVDGGPLPEQHFEPDRLRAVVRAWVGNAATNPTDPIEIAEQFRRRGLECRVAASPGGPALEGDALHARLQAQSSFHLYATKPQSDKPVSARDLKFTPYSVRRDRTRSTEDIYDDRHTRLFASYGPDFTIGYKTRKVPSASMDDFLELLDTIVALPRLVFRTMHELEHLPKPENAIPFSFKHDVDGDMETALRMAQEQAARGIRATYYIIHTGPYYGHFDSATFVRYERMADAYRQLEALGHDVGLHFNPYHLYRKLGVDGFEAISTELAWLRSLGLRVVSAFGHSSTSVMGVESIELLMDHTRENPTLWATGAPMLNGISEFQGARAPRLLAWARSLGIEAVGEIMLRRNDSCYFSVVSQERCNGRVALDRSWTSVSVHEMVHAIRGIEDGPFIVLNIHPLTFGQRASSDRECETACLDEGRLHREFDAEFQIERYRPDTLQVARKTGSGGRVKRVLNFSNDVGMLDYPLDRFDHERPGIVVLGGSRVDAPDIGIPAQIVGWLRDSYAAQGDREISIQKFALAGAGPAQYQAFMTTAAQRCRIGAVACFLGREFIDAAGGIDAALTKLSGLIDAWRAMPADVVLCLDDLPSGDAAKSPALEPAWAGMLEIRFGGAASGLQVLRLSSCFHERFAPARGLGWEVFEHQLIAARLFGKLRTSCSPIAASTAAGSAGESTRNAAMAPALAANRS